MLSDPVAHNELALRVAIAKGMLDGQLARCFLCGGDPSVLGVVAEGDVLPGRRIVVALCRSCHERPGRGFEAACRKLRRKLRGTTA
jgi:hypothetical protein